MMSYPNSGYRICFAWILREKTRLAKAPAFSPDATTGGGSATSTISLGFTRTVDLNQRADWYPCWSGSARALIVSTVNSMSPCSGSRSC